jgi:multidrug efflux pump subunit AcrB
MNRTGGLLLIVFLAILGVASLAVVGTGAVFVLVLWLKAPADPTVAAPILRISARYDGAAPQEIEDAVILPIEAQLESMEGVDAIESISREDGIAAITLYLRPGTDPKVAQVIAQNRISLAIPVIPMEVQTHGIRVIRTRPLPAIWLVLGSPDQSRDLLFLRDLAQTALLPNVQATAGVEEATAAPGGGPQPRVWLDPDKLATHNLVAADVEQLFREPPGAMEKIAPEEVSDMIVKVDAAGRIVKIRDVGRVEMAGTDPGLSSRWHGNYAAVIAVFGDPAQVHDAVQERLSAWREKMPRGAELDLLPGPSSPGVEGLVIDARLPDAASPERVRRAAEQVAGKLEALRDPRAERLVPAVVALPANDPQAFRLYVALCPPGERAWTSADVSDRARRVVDEELKDAEYRVAPPTAVGLPPRRRAPVVLLVSGPEHVATVRLAIELTKRLAGSGALANVWPDYAQFVPKSTFHVDRQKAQQLGVDPADVSQTLQIFLGPAEHRGAIAVRVGQPGPAPLERVWKADGLINLKVRNLKGEMVPLGDLVKTQELISQSFTYRLNGQRCLLITADPAPGMTADDARRRCREIATEARKKLKLGDAYKLEFP